MGEQDDDRVWLSEDVGFAALAAARGSAGEDMGFVAAAVTRYRSRPHPFGVAFKSLSSQWRPHACTHNDCGARCAYLWPCIAIAPHMQSEIKLASTHNNHSVVHRHSRAMITLQRLQNQRATIQPKAR